jgi:hypothetical protein
MSKVQINTKLYTSGIYLNLEQPSYIPESVRRWLRQDSRDETIKKINRIIIRSLDEYARDTTKNAIYKYHLLEAKKGLLNLRETYSNCIQTVARIDTLITKIETIETPNDKQDKVNTDVRQNGVDIDNASSDSFDSSD